MQVGNRNPNRVAQRRWQDIIEESQNELDFLALRIQVERHERAVHNRRIAEHPSHRLHGFVSLWEQNFQPLGPNPAAVVQREYYAQLRRHNALIAQRDSGSPPPQPVENRNVVVYAQEQHIPQPAYQAPMIMQPRSGSYANYLARWS